jgi:hypothetical protein
MWLFALDAIGLLLLGLGLAMQFAPDSTLSQALPAAFRLPLLAVGCWRSAGRVWRCRCWITVAADPGLPPAALA